MSTFPTSKLVTISNSVYYVSIKVFNSLPNWIADLVQNKKICIDKLNSVLMEVIAFSN